MQNDAIKRLLPWLVAVAFFMQSLDTTILNTAVPAIARAMEVAPLSVKSVLASYTLSLAVFIPVSGWMADRFGTRRVFAAAIALFTLGSVAVWPVDQPRDACGLPRPAGRGRCHDDAGRPYDAGAHLRQDRSRPRHELCRHPQPGWPHGRAGRRRPDRHLSRLARRVLCQRSGRPARHLLRVPPPAGLSRTADPSARLRRAWCCSAAASRSCPTCWRYSATTN